jgi:hypothetical protein
VNRRDLLNGALASALTMWASPRILTAQQPAGARQIPMMQPRVSGLTKTNWTPMSFRRKA